MKTHRPKTWWMCLNPYHEGDKPTVRHETLGAAGEEARRLCLKTGRKIHVLQLVGTMHPPIPQPVNPVWEDRHV
jgi:hypothetical protein